MLKARKTVITRISSIKNLTLKDKENSNEETIIKGANVVDEQASCQNLSPPYQRRRKRNSKCLDCSVFPYMY